MNNRYKGQALTEFLITAAAVLVPLFLLYPLFGKLFDMHFSTQMAARYAAWERTVWFDQSEEPDETTLEFVATRSDTLVENSINNRFFAVQGKTPKPIEENDVLSGSDSAKPIWTYLQSGESIHESTEIEAGSLGRKESPSVVVNGLITAINQGFGAVTRPIRSLLSVVGSDNDDFLTFAHETRNYYTPTVTSHLDTGNASTGDQSVLGGVGRTNNNVESWIFQNWDGRFESRAALLADGWNTQSLEHFEERVDDGVLSTVLDNDVINTFIDIAEEIEPSVGNLEFGWVGTEPLPDAEVECNEELSVCFFE